MAASDTALQTMPVERAAVLDPPPEYSHLREAAGVTRMRFPSGHTGWVVTRFDEGCLVFSDNERFTAMRPRHEMSPDEDGRPSDVADAMPRSLVSLDEPEHNQLRRLVNYRFTVRRVREDLQPYIDRIVAEHLQAMATGPNPTDLVDALAKPVPCLVICELLGVPYGDRDEFVHHSEVMMETSLPKADRDAGMAWLLRYVAKLVKAKRADPDAGGLLAELARRVDEGTPTMSNGDLISMGVLLLFAGHDTSLAQIALSVQTLLQHPEQKRVVIEEPEKTGAVVEDLMRYLTIVQFGLGRVAKVDLELCGQPIRKGELVVVAMNACNRDPRAFADPDVPDHEQATRKHLAFGYGVHQCLGQHIARAEIITVLRELFARFPSLSLAEEPDAVPMNALNTFYSPRRLMVSW
jgi:cytochrome P450